MSTVGTTGNMNGYNSAIEQHEAIMTSPYDYSWLVEDELLKEAQEKSDYEDYIANCMYDEGRCYDR